MLYSSLNSILQNDTVKSGSIEMVVYSVNVCKESVHADSDSIGMVRNIEYFIIQGVNAKTDSTVKPV